MGSQGCLLPGKSDILNSIAKAKERGFKEMGQLRVMHPLEWDSES